MAKLFAGELAQRVAYDCLQLTAASATSTRPPSRARGATCA